MSDSRAADALKKQQMMYKERWAAVNGAQARAGAPEPLPKAEADAVRTLASHGNDATMIATMLKVDEAAVDMVLHPEKYLQEKPKIVQLSEADAETARTLAEHGNDAAMIAAMLKVDLAAVDEALHPSDYAADGGRAPAAAAAAASPRPRQSSSRPQLKKSDSEYARELQRELDGEEAAADAAAAFGGGGGAAAPARPAFGKSDSDFARELQNELGGGGGGGGGGAAAPARPAFGRQASWHAHAAGEGAAALAGFDAMGAFSYTTELLDRMPGNPVPMDIVVRDARVAQAAGRITLEQQGFTLEPWPTRLPQKRFYKPENVEREYYPEMEALIKRVTGAVEVVIVNNIVRNAGKADKRGNSNPFAGGGNGVNGYANIVHTDFRAKKSVEKFYQRPDHHEKSHAEGGAMAGGVAGKFILINAWRNISDTDPIYNNTLACCDQQTVDEPEDYISVDVPLTPEAHAEQYRLVTQSAHKHAWYYYPHMTKDEVLLFMQFDSDPEAAARFCFHTAFNDPAVDPELPQRQSVEVRAIAFLPTPTPRELGGRSLADVVAHLHPGDTGKLRRMLAAGAARGLVHQKEIDDLLDQAAYTGANNDEYIATLCYERGKPYDPSMWHENAASKRIVEQLDREKAREREKFLNPPPPPHRLPDEDQDVGQLRRMFPKVNPDAVRALYRGFAGNFETTMEMLALALAEENGSVHHG